MIPRRATFKFLTNRLKKNTSLEMTGTCFKDVLMVFTEGFRSILRKIEECFEGACWLFQEYFKEF